MNRSDHTDSDGDTPEPAAGRRHRRAVSQGIEVPLDDVRSWDEDDRAWGQGPDDNNERLLREKPPHWA